MTFGEALEVNLEMERNGPRMVRRRDCRTHTLMVVLNVVGRESKRALERGRGVLSGMLMCFVSLFDVNKDLAKEKIVVLEEMWRMQRGVSIY